MTEQPTWPPAGVDWYYSDDYTAIAHGDCRELLRKMPKVDLVLTSPPYNVKKSYPCDDWSTWAAYYDFLQSVHSLLPRVPQGWLFPFSLNGDDGLIRATWSECGLPWKRVRLVLRHPDVDDSKSLIAFPPRVEILCLTEWVEMNGPKILWIPHAKFQGGKQGFEVGHPASFHEKLVAAFVKMYPSGKSILDPFMGSGTTPQAYWDRN